MSSASKIQNPGLVETNPFNKTLQDGATKILLQDTNILHYCGADSCVVRMKR